jgi:signal transduction histidine kinase
VSDRSDLQQRLRFIGLDAEDAELLRALRPELERSAERIVRVFYRHLLSFPEMRELLSDAQVKARLLVLQKQYLLSLAPPSLDARYVEERLRIGRAHHRVGLEPRWYLGAYSLYFRLLVPLVSEALRGQPLHAERAVAALNKVLMLDAQLAMEAYIGRREERLEYLNRELATAGNDLQRVYERQSDELRETTARVRAVEQLASLGTVVAGLAHEIGTPMGVIQGHAELLESSVADEPARRRLRTIREQIDRISHILHTLLHMGRPRRTELQRVELRSVVEQSLSFLSEKFRRHRVSAKLQPGPSAAILGDVEKLQQVFLNLFLNAVDAMPQGGEIRVELQRLAHAAEVRVADTGHGIPPELIERIFDPFFTTKPAGQGNGLGLMVVQGIVSDHGGVLAVQSRVGEGTEFRIQLPVAEVAGA